MKNRVIYLKVANADWSNIPDNISANSNIYIHGEKLGKAFPKGDQCVVMNLDDFKIDGFKVTTFQNGAEGIYRAVVGDYPHLCLAFIWKANLNENMWVTKGFVVDENEFINDMDLQDEILYKYIEKSTCI